MGRKVIIICDGCGKTSPDEKGNYIANHWHEIVEQEKSYISRRKHTYQICVDCWALILNTLNTIGVKQE